MTTTETAAATAKGTTSPEQFSHDAAYRALFAHPETVTSLLWDCVPEPFVRELDFSTLERVSGEYVSADLHHAYGDQVWRARWKNFPGWCYLVILIEFQRKPERMMAFRLWSYQALVLQRLWDEGQLPRNEAGQELLPLLFSVVVYNGEGAWTAPLDLRGLSGAVPESLRDYQPQLKYCLVDVHRLVLDKPEHRNSLMAAVARIERAMRFRDIKAALGALNRVVKLYGKRSLLEVFVAWICKRFDAMGVPGNWKRELNNFEEVEDVLNLGEMWKQEWRAEGFAEGQAEGFAEGQAEGRAEGRAEGLAEGELKNQRWMLAAMLAHSVAAPLPRNLADWLAEETNLELLRRLTIAAAHVDSMSAFQALVDKERGGNPKEA